MEGQNKRSTRLGIDLDSKNRFRMLKAVINSGKFVGNVAVEVSGHGYHLKLQLPTLLDFEENIQYRMILGDDPYRIGADERRHALGVSFTDVLFDVKFHGGKLVSKPEPINPMAKEWWSWGDRYRRSLRRRYER